VKEKPSGHISFAGRDAAEAEVATASEAVAKAGDMVGTSVAPTQSSTQKAASNLSRRVELILVSAGFFLWGRLSCWSAPMLEVRVTFIWYECVFVSRVPAALVAVWSCIVWQGGEVVGVPSPGL
jgi:hypothetical protein